MTKHAFNLFSVLGLEIEYMLVDKDSLDIQPGADFLLEKAGGVLVNEVSLGDIAMSNELVMHVIELKNDGPKPLNAPFALQFQSAIQKLEPWLAEKNLLLLPTAAHPWMDPLKETRRWPHGNREVYQQYDAIFDCKGHGWSNLQSMHINLPYADDEEFFKLHSAIRLLLPLIPALAASSPFIDGKRTGFLDTRLDYYQRNQQKVPEIAGAIIPEFIQSPDAYQEQILKPMYRAIGVYDKEKLLQQEWLNSRGAIPKFSMGAIEIRIVDTQECVDADIAIALVIVNLLKQWLDRSDFFLLNPCSTPLLKVVFDETLVKGFQTAIALKALKKQWQLPEKVRNVHEFWSYWVENISTHLDQKSQLVMEHILSQGNLSERLLKTVRNSLDRSRLRTCYRQLATCLSTNRLYHNEE